MGVQKVRMPTGIKVVKISFRRIYLYGNRNDLGNQTRDCSCYILVNNISTFCSCPKILREAENSKVLD